MKKYTDKEKRLILSFDEFRNLRVSDVPFDNVKDFDSAENPLLDVVYALDERTKLPKGDIALFLSANTSPEVRSFITQFLHGEMPDTPALPADSDIDFTRYMREKGESISDYAQRMTDVIRKDKLREVEMEKISKNE